MLGAFPIILHRTADRVGDIAAVGPEGADSIGQVGDVSQQEFAMLPGHGEDQIGMFQLLYLGRLAAVTGQVESSVGHDGDRLL